MKSRQSPNNKNADLLRYAGLGAQVFVSLGIAVFAGMKADKWLDFPTPLLVWILPLIVIVVMIYKVIRSTSSKPTNRNEKEL